jgi:predicted esterase
MTKEERDKDIEDYCNYLDQVYQTYIAPLGKNVIVNAMGFSQGGATVCRWAATTNCRIDNLIVWGSVIPPDMNWEADLPKLSLFNWIYVAGDKDEFLTLEQQKEQLLLLGKHHIKPDAVFYEGGHDITDAALGLLTQKCVKKD